MRPHGKAFVEVPPNGPWAVCDRCSFLFNRKNLRYQWDYRGGQMVNTRLFVCDRCHDEPFVLNKPIFLPIDPEPVLDARPENMIPVDDSDSSGLPIATDEGLVMTTEDDLIITAE